MLASLVVNDVINLSFLMQLHEEHNFLNSPRAASFIGHTLSAISKLRDPEEAESIYKASGTCGWSAHTHSHFFHFVSETLRARADLLTCLASPPYLSLYRSRHQEFCDAAAKGDH